MDSELDAQEIYQEDILKRSKKPKKILLGTFRKYGKSGKISATFNQQKTLFKALPWPMQLCKLLSSILSYPKMQGEGIRRDSKKERKTEKI